MAQVPVRLVKNKKKCKLKLVSNKNVIALRQSKKEIFKSYVNQFLKNNIEFIIIANNIEDRAQIYSTEFIGRTVYLLEKAKAIMLCDIDAVTPEDNKLS